MRRLTISLKDEDYEGVAALAEAEERSLNWVIGKAVRQFLKIKRLEPERQVETWARAKRGRR